jgi:hypothetical protein
VRKEFPSMELFNEYRVSSVVVRLMSKGVGIE